MVQTQLVCLRTFVCTTCRSSALQLGWALCLLAIWKPLLIAALFRCHIEDFEYTLNKLLNSLPWPTTWKTGMCCTPRLVFRLDLNTLISEVSVVVKKA